MRVVDFHTANLPGALALCASPADTDMAGSNCRAAEARPDAGVAAAAAVAVVAVVAAVAAAGGAAAGSAEADTAAWRTKEAAGRLKCRKDIKRCGGGDVSWHLSICLCLCLL